MRGRPEQRYGLITSKVLVITYLEGIFAYTGHQLDEPTGFSGGLEQ